MEGEGTRAASVAMGRLLVDPAVLVTALRGLPIFLRAPRIGRNAAGSIEMIATARRAGDVEVGPEAVSVPRHSRWNSATSAEPIRRLRDARINARLRQPISRYSIPAIGPSWR